VNLLTDKYSLGYAPVYQELLAGRKDAAVLEVGIMYGGSLLLWHDLTTGPVVGINDRDVANWPDWAGKIISDQANPHLPELLDYQKFDLIVDDASHMGSKSRATFALLWPLVKPGGWYVLEDWSVGMPSSPYFPGYEGNSMLKLAQSFVEYVAPDQERVDMGGVRLHKGEDGTASEARYRFGMAMLRKNE
jgi:hypothetical protein